MTGTDGTMMTRAVFAGVTGVLYVVLGSLQVLAGLGLRGEWSEALYLNGGAMDGYVLIVVGSVLVQGYRELRQGLHEGVAFLYIGILLALFFAIVELSSIGASYMGAWTIGGDFAGYSALDVLSPALYLSPLPLAGLLVWRRGFTLHPRGVQGGGTKDLNNVNGGLQ
jgi:hypothetical protein